MKEYEKYTLLVLLFSIVFVIGQNILIFIAFGSLFVYFLKSKRYLGIILIGLMMFSNQFKIFNKELIVGEIYKIKVFIDKNIEIKEIDGRIPRNKIYLKESSIENNIGYFYMNMKVNKINKNFQMIFLEGNIENVEEGYFNKYRNKIRNIIERTKYSFQVESFVKAIVLGEKSNLGKDLEENYRKVGASHILTISGLHIGIVISAFLGIFHYFGFSYKMKYSLSLGILSLYVLILGNNPAVVRAYIMGAIFMLSKIFFEKASVKKSYCVSIIIVNVINPLIIKDISFMMSYSALFGIIYIFDKYRKDNIYYNILLLSLVVQIVLSPVTIYYFKTLYIYTFIFNIFIVIWGSFLINLIFFGLFLESLRLGLVVREFIEFFYKVLDTFIKFCNKFSYATWEIERDLGFYYFIFLILLIILLYVNKTYFGYFLIIGIFIYKLLPYQVKIENEYVYFPKEKILVILKDKEGNIYKSKAKKIITYKREKEDLDRYFILKDKEELAIEKFIFKNIKNREIQYEITK